MRRIFKIGLTCFILLGIVGAALLFYLNQVVLPAKVRGWAEVSLSEALGRKVSVGRVQLHPWHGILIEQVVVEEDARYGKTPFLQIDRASGGILFLPIFKERRVIIPVLRIVRPQVRLIQDPNGIWNIQSLQWKAAPGKPKKPNLGVFIPRIVLTNGQLELNLQRPSSPLKLNLQNLNVEAGLSLPGRIRFSITSYFRTAPPTYEARTASGFFLKLNGDYNLKSHQFSLQGSSTVSLADINALLPPNISPLVTLLNGIGTFNVNASGNLAGPLFLHTALEMDGLQLKAKLPLQPKPIQAEGNLRADLKGHITSLGTLNVLKALSGSIELRHVSLSPLLFLDELHNLTGNVRLNPHGIRTDSMTGALPSGRSLTMIGSLAYDEKNSVQLKINTTLPFDQIPLQSPTVRRVAERVRLAGEVDVEANWEGALRPTLTLRPTFLATLHHFSLDLPFVGPIRELEGSLFWQKDLITATKIRGQLQSQPFEAEGTLVNFALPEIDGRASWGKLSAEGRATYDGHRAEIHSLSGRWGKGLFHLFGEVTDSKKGPFGILYGETTFKLEELWTLLPQAFPQALSWKERLPLQGQTQTRWLLEGPLLEPKKWSVNLKTSSDRLLFREIPLEQVSLHAQQKDEIVTVNALRTNLLGGRATLVGSVNLEDPKIPWEGRLTLQGAELARLSETLQWQTRDLSGQLSLQCEYQAEGIDPSSLQGDGTIQIQGGRILELPFLGHFADMLRMPSFRKIVFETAEGSFTLGKGQLKTENLQLKAPRAALSVFGSGGFLSGMESPIEWHLVPTLSPELLPEETQSTLGQVIAQGAGYLIGEIRVTGTWKNPKSRFVSKPVTQILNEQLFNLQDLLKDLF